MFTIPNFVTLLNLISGILAIIFLLEGHWSSVWIFIVISLVADFLDGFLARVLNQKSPIGKELDSLADAVSFGVVPSIFFYKLLELYQPTGLIKYFPLIIACFAVLRLAKFNTDDRQTDSFYGIPTPLVTIVSLGYFQSLTTPSWLFSSLDFLHHPLILIPFISILSILMILDIRMLSLKFSTWNFRDNQYRYILLIASIVFLVIFHWFAPLLILPIYVLLSFLNNSNEIHSRD